MSARPLDNAAPTIYAPAAGASSSRRKSGKAILWDDADLNGYEEDAGSASDVSDGEAREEIDAEEVYGAWIFQQSGLLDKASSGNADISDLLRSITDPEHPVSLEQLRVVNPDDIKVSGNRVLVYLTPTIPHCSMSTLIGTFPVWACLKVRHPMLDSCSRFKPRSLPSRSCQNYS